MSHMVSAVVLLLLVYVWSCTTGTPLTCYTGFKFLSGVGVGDQSKVCESENDYCYNMTANDGSFLSVAKAGCSTFRCILARDSCQRTEFQGVPVSFCCCSGDLCNGKSY